MDRRESDEPRSPANDLPAASAATVLPGLDQCRPESTTASPPPFEPLFTLLTNATTNLTIHPRVRYLFTDDDTSVLSTPSSPGAPPHRAILIDLAPTPDNSRWVVSSASSLSPDFAVTASRLTLLRADADADPGSDAGSAAVTLRIDGVEREPLDMRLGSQSGSGSNNAAAIKDDIEYLVDDFRRRMAVLRSVVSEGERTREALAKLQEQDQS